MATSYAKWSLADLHKEQARIEKAIASKEGREKKNVLAKVTNLARKHGFSLNELTEGKSAYRSLTDKSQTWTGRGRTPLWVQEHESAGGSRTDLLIKKKQ